MMRRRVTGGVSEGHHGPNKTQSVGANGATQVSWRPQLPMTLEVAEAVEVPVQNLHHSIRISAVKEGWLGTQRARPLGKVKS